MAHRLNFKLEARASGSAARACTFQTLHNEVKTPVFMPVATFGALRNQNTQQVLELGFPVLLANTYHLFLRPGVEVFKQFGGIHRFMNWEKSVLTDSGGFQLFSLPGVFRITEEGARFRSRVDGREHLYSPELAIQTQRFIGSDIMMALDQCISSKSDQNTVSDAAELTTRWAERSLNARGESMQALFGIVQGGCFPELRQRSAGQITALPFDGYAIGGLAVGEEDNELIDMVALTAPLLPVHQPRYLMGIGTPLQLLEAVHQGVDMFDCIMPTIMGEQGVAYTSEGKIELRRSVHKYADRPLDEKCRCLACKSYSRAYLHHLRKTGESFGSLLVGLHNLHFYKNLMDDMRAYILKDDFLAFYQRMKPELICEDKDNPPVATVVKPKKNRQELRDFEVIANPAGFHSIRQKSSGEVMHSVTDPAIEAQELYVNQSGFQKTLSLRQEDFVIWDVGLGAGTNAMATILEAQKLFGDSGDLEGSSQVPGRLRIISFEQDLDPLRLARKNPGLFPHVCHAAVPALLKDHKWNSRDNKIEWVLLPGDFKEVMNDAPTPDCIYYDMFSLKTDNSLWNHEIFSHIFVRGKISGTSLFTYSSSTQVRAALLYAGFWVAKGAGTGPKTDTTAAFTTKACTVGFSLLDASWLRRWHRSDSRYPLDATEEQKAKIDKRIIGHEQFKTV